MAQDLLFPGNILSLHRAAVDKLARQGDGDAALLYLVLAAVGNSGALPWGPEKVEGAKNTLIQLGLLPSDAAVLPPVPQKLEDDRPPEYTSQDIAQALQDRKGFRDLVPAVEQLLGKVLSPSDLKILYTLYDFLALPPEVLLTLTGWCVEQAKAKGPGRKPTLPQIRREAYKWQKAGIDTLEAADAHLRRLTRLNQRGTELIQLLFGESRAPVAKEAEYLDQWIQKGFPDDLLLLARDRTIYHLQSFKWSYMNGILNRWQAKGLATVEAVEAYDGTLLFVSHDRYFIQRFATRIWELADGTITDYPMGFAQYRAVKAQEKAPQPVKAPEKKGDPRPPRGNRSQQAARRQLTICETGISKLEAECRRLDEEMAAHACDAGELNRLYQEKQEVEARLEQEMARWEELSLQIEE